MRRRIRGSPSGSLPQLLRTLEQRLPRVQLGRADDVLEELRQRPAEPGARPKANPDQVVAADGQVANSMRLRALLGDDLPKAREPGELLDGRTLALALEIRLPVVEHVRQERLAVAREQPSGTQPVGTVRVEHVRA